MLADPHTLVLDEATSLIDPRAARHLERSMAAVLHGRTVIAIAHRLFSAHDADRVAVVEDGKITELGSHDELVAAGGSYAALWDSWNGKRLTRCVPLEPPARLRAEPLPLSLIRMPECTLYLRLIEISTAVSGSSWRASRSLPALMPSRPVTARASSIATALPSSESPTQRTSSSR